jgi:glycosyltransferase involved in cell wall biosynthesis
MNKVLIITYYWPPGSGAGVQRWLKFSKYLPQFGWEPVVLTVEPEFAAYPAVDPSLEEEISPGLRVFKTKATDYFRIYSKDKGSIPSAGFATDDKKGLKGKILRFIRGNIFIPDPRKGWNSYAFRKACEIIDKEYIRHIITTSPPHSTQLVGLKLKRKYPELKWIADLRDPWTDIYYYDQFYPTFISKRIDSDFECRVLRSADRIITVGKSLKALFAKKYTGIDGKVEVIPNGFDEDDFAAMKPVTPDEFTISYIGTLSDAYPSGGFLDALQSLYARGRTCKLRFIGTISPNQKKLVLAKIQNDKVEFMPHVSHETAIKYMMNSSLLLLIIPDHKSNKTIITGKIFEYIASGIPVICMGPEDGDAADILKACHSGETIRYDDPSSTEEYIVKMMNSGNTPDAKAIAEFSRRSATKHLSEILQAE